MHEAWWAQLLNGFNILCVGVGSKKVSFPHMQVQLIHSSLSWGWMGYVCVQNVIMRFVASHLRGEHCIVVNGFFPSISIKQVQEGVKG